MTARGIVFVATQHDRYVEEAIRSAASARRHVPDLPITLFTDRLPPEGHFDAVEQIVSASVGDARANAIINRFTGLARTPYERTLYLDTEALIVNGAVADVFDVLDSCDVALAEDVAGTSDAMAHTGRRMFNCGVILYHRNAAAPWLESWRAATLRNLELAGKVPVPLVPEIAAVADPVVRKWLLGVDKIALLGVLPPDRPQSLARVHTLEQAFNYRGPSIDETVKIHHPHDRRVTAT